MTPAVIKTITFQFEVQCPNLMRHFMPPNRICY